MSFVVQLSLLGGQAARVGGGSLTRSNSAVQAVSQGQAWGRCRVIRRAEVATRAGTRDQFAAHGRGGGVDQSAAR